MPPRAPTLPAPSGASCSTRGAWGALVRLGHSEHPGRSVGQKHLAARCAPRPFRHHRRQPVGHARQTHPGAVGVRTLSCERCCPPLATFPRGAAPSDLLARRRGLGNRAATIPSIEGSAGAWSRCDLASGARRRPASRTLRRRADRRRCRPPAPETAPSAAPWSPGRGAAPRR